MTDEPSAQPTLPDAKQSSKQPDKEKEMVRVQEEAAKERAAEGGYQ
jgi:hypothetical protein